MRQPNHDPGDEDGYRENRTRFFNPRQVEITFKGIKIAGWLIDSPLTQDPTDRRTR